MNDSVQNLDLLVLYGTMPSRATRWEDHLCEDPCPRRPMIAGSSRPGIMSRGLADAKRGMGVEGRRS